MMWILKTIMKIARFCRFLIIYLMKYWIQYPQSHFEIKYNVNQKEKSYLHKY